MSTAYRPDVDGLRALAVGSVVLFHAFPLTLPGGFLGVDVFFVISGFLITGLILAGIRDRTFTITGFYLRRARRILPALLAMLVGITALALLILMPDELERFAHDVIASALFVPNLLFATQTGYFDPSNSTNPLLHLWSLGVEEQFYLFWPLALIAFVPRVKPAATVAIIVTVIVASFALHVIVSWYSASLSFYLPFTRFWQLLTGALLAACAQSRETARDPSKPPPPARPPWRANAMSVVGIALIVGSVLLTRAGGETFVGVAVPATLGAAAFIAAGPDAWLNRTLFSWRPVVYVGLISYPLYLWHWPPLSFLRILDVNEGASGRVLRIAAVLLALLAAMATYHFIEVPVRRRRDLARLGVKLAGGLAVAAVAGVALAASGGLPQRTQIAYNPFVWGPARRLDERCADLYAQPEKWRKNAFCLRNDYAHDPDIAIIGDSHANMFVPGVIAAYPQASVLQIGASACPPLRDSEFWNDNRRAWRELCPIVVAGAYRALAPGTHVVILIARMPMYTATPAQYAESFDFVSPKHFESPEFPGASAAQVYERALRRDVTQLLASGREVVLVMPLPALDFLPRSCVRLRPIDRFRPAPPADACTVPRPRVDAQLDASRAIIARVAGELANPDLHVVDPESALCDARRCRAVRDTELLYRDDNHLSIAGSRYVWSRIRPRGLRGLAPFERSYLSSQ